MSIYAKHYLDYLQAGYSVTPSKGKRPLIREWTKYCRQLPSNEEVESWASTFTEANIDICLGEASGIIALDLDCVDQELLDQIEYLLPDSPVEKVGSKGYTRFFKYNGESTQVLSRINTEGKKEVVLELLSTDKKTTIPPSIHPNGNEYVWTKQNLLETPRSELPSFPPLLFAHLTSKLKSLESTSYSSTKVDSGRNSALSSYVSELIKDQVDIETAIQKLIDHDVEVNEVPLFTDGKENRGKVAFINAAKFYTSHLESINLKRERESMTPELPIKSSSQILVTPSKKKEVELEMPQATGILKQIQDYILSRSFVEQPAFAMSASLVFLSTLISRKMTFQNVTPNLYVMNIGASGSGKDSCQQSIKALLHASKASSLFGAATYPSEASILVGLDTQPARIDIIDEASSFLKSASSGGASYQTGIGDLLCELYSCSNDHYLGKVLASNGGQKVGECHRPHLNILCSTTYKGLGEAINNATLEKGLFARFFVYFGEDSTPAKRVKNSTFIPQDLVDSLQYWHSFQNPLATGNISGNQPAYQVGITAEADAELDKCFREFDSVRLSTGSTGILRPVAARLYQQMLKIVLISAVSNTENGGIPKVNVTDVQFAYKLTQFFYQNVSRFIKDSLYENSRARNMNRVLAFIKEGGDKGIAASELIKFCTSMKTSERIEIIKDLKESNQITMYLGEGESSERETMFKLAA